MKASTYIMSFFLFFAAPAMKAQALDEMTGPPANKTATAPFLDPSDPFYGLKDQSAGFYSHGHLMSADELPIEGRGFTKIIRPRHRGFASYDMIFLITHTADQLALLFPNKRDSVQVGDISPELGGKTKQHASHQNGLDADIAFIRKNETIQDPADETGFKEKFVKARKLTANFDLERNWTFAKLLVATGRVQRIFVNAVVKKAFCKYAKSTGELLLQAETLRRLRPYEGHEDHFHVRITCPVLSLGCEAQEEVPLGSGC